MTIHAYIPNDIYTAKVYNHSGELYKVLQQWDRLEYTQRLNDPWNHSIQFRVSPEDELGPILRNMVRDYFVIIERYDVVTQKTNVVYEGLHQTSREQTQTDGNIIFTLYGAGYTKLLDRRLVVPPHGQENVQKSGAAETLAKEFVYESCVSPTGFNIDFVPNQSYAAFTDATRIIPGLVVASSLNRGNETDYTARFTNLDSVVKKICEDGGLDYGIYGGDDLGEFVFDCRPIWGKDRRRNNTAGNKPAVFSIEFNNMLIPILSTNHRHEKNWIFVGGAGQGEKRLIVQVADETAANISPWARSELFVDSRKGETGDELVGAGKAALEERGVKQEFDFDLNMTEGSRWIRDWNLGDYITADYRGLSFDKQIVEITAVVSLGGAQPEVLTIDLEDI